MIKNVIDIENKHTSGVYHKQNIVFVRGEGACLWDIEGNEYLDCNAGHGVANLGHAHPIISTAIAEQSKQLITLFETFYNDRRALLLEKLTALMPGMERVFLCNSGTESIEAAIKFSRLSTGRSVVVAAMRGFHGRTLGALSATWNKKYREPFEPLVPGFHHVPYNQIPALEEAITNQTAALLLEVIQGEGGVYPANPEYIQAARRLCTERGALLIIDEVQTGFGRTGKMFAIQHHSILPDMMCMAKSLAGGIPAGAVLLADNVQNLTPGVHGSTFGGNPLVCAAALAVLQIFEEQDIPGQAAIKGKYLMERLKNISSPLIRDIRGMGLMIGIELKQKVSPYLQQLLQHHVLALNAGLSTIRLLPPLVISYPQLDRLAETLAIVLTDENTSKS